MSFVKDFFENYILISAICGWLIAQILKFIVSLFKREKINYLTLLSSTGGMPSSHSATVVALCVGSGIQEGISSPYFAISAIFAMIVMIDASGVRYETGEQSKILNKITRELFSGDPEMANSGLKELVGHTPFQVIMGAITGACVAVALGFLMNNIPIVH